MPTTALNGKRRTNTRSPDKIDAHVGARLRARRVAVGMAQGVLASRTGTTFQQIQKYEAGLNRISTSRLYKMAQVLKCEPQYFFDGLSDANHRTVAAHGELAEFMRSSEALYLCRAFMALPDRSSRDAVREFVGAVAGSEGGSVVGRRAYRTYTAKS